MSNAGLRLLYLCAVICRHGSDTFNLYFVIGIVTCIFKMKLVLCHRRLMVIRLIE